MPLMCEKNSWVLSEEYFQKLNPYSSFVYNRQAFNYLQITVLNIIIKHKNNIVKDLSFLIHFQDLPQILYNGGRYIAVMLKIEK